MRLCRQELQDVVLRTKPAKAAQFVRDLAPEYVPGTRSLRHVSSHATETAAILRYREKVHVVLKCVQAFLSTLGHMNILANRALKPWLANFFEALSICNEFCSSPRTCTTKHITDWTGGSQCRLQTLEQL